MSRRVFAGFLVGILLVQGAWIAAMPAFRGPDEFDHVFRAEGVSHGAIMPGESIDRSEARGAMTPVRQSVIDAASRVCASYKYPRYYDCHAYGGSRGTWNEIGSGAGRYNPAYYLIVGTMARAFDGVSVDYAIRALTAIMCALMLAWAAAMWSGMGRSRIRTLAFVTALTPVLLFSTTIAAPNGVSYAAAVLLWVAALALLDEGAEQQRGQATMGVAVGAVVMCNTHTTGPLWLMLIALTLALFKPAGALTILRARRYWALSAVVGAGAAASLAWTFVSGANMPNQTAGITSSPELGRLAVNEVAWLLQTIAAFPLRNEFAPPAVYVLWLVPFIMLIVSGIRARGNTLPTVLWMIAAIIFTQTVLTYVGFKTDGYAWQGRYGLPFTVGLALIPAFSDAGRTKPNVALYHCALAAMAIATGVSVWNVAHNERLFFQRPWTDYVPGGPTAAGLAAALGTAFMTWTLTRGLTSPNEPTGGAEPRQAVDRLPMKGAVG